MENIVLLECIYWLNSHFKCSFKNILEKKQEHFSLQSPPFVCLAWSVYRSASSPRNLFYPRKIPGCAPVTFNLTFHPNFHPNILVFANLPIYRKLIHDNISLVFGKAKIFYLVLFWRRYKILFLHINICIIETLVSVILKKIYIIFIYKY